MKTCERTWTLAPLLVAVGSPAFAQGTVLDAPSWTAESNQAGADFGASVASAGDVNGDGFDDVIVGAPRFDHGQNREGRAFLYWGSAGGLSPQPVWTAESDRDDATFGQSVASAGDVNGDGFDDVIVGAPRFTNGQALEGRAYVYLGSSAGVSLTADWTVESDQDQAWFGSRVASAGDTNGDGFDDVVIGAYSFSGGQTMEGRAYVYLGSAAGLSLTAVWTAESDQDFARFGWSVACAGDVNGDGFDDVIIGARTFNGMDGRAYVYLGSAAGPSPTAVWTAESDPGGFFGESVASADVNDDGFDDVIVGAPWFNGDPPQSGRVFLYLGSLAGPASVPSWTAESDAKFGRLGGSVASAGDVNGDGFEDVVIGTDVTSGKQRAYVYLGSPSGLSLVPEWTAQTTLSNAGFGSSVASAGDVNGDGTADVIVGAFAFHHGEISEGRAFLFQGDAEPVGTSYCLSSVNSSANRAFIAASGSDVVSDQDLTLRTGGCPPSVSGVYFLGTASIAVPFGDGHQCVGGSIRRITPVVNTGPSGAASRVLDFAAPYASPIVAGRTLRFQLSFRDPAAGLSGFNYSNGLRIAFQ